MSGHPIKIYCWRQLTNSHNYFRTLLAFIVFLHLKTNIWTINVPRQRSHRTASTDINETALLHLRPITQHSLASSRYLVLYDFLVTVKAAPHECVIRTGQAYA